MITPMMADVSLFISYASISLSTMVPYHERKNHPDTTPARNPMVPALRMLPGRKLNTMMATTATAAAIDPIFSLLSILYKVKIQVFSV